MKRISLSIKLKDLPWGFFVALVFIILAEFFNAKWDNYFYTTETKTTQAAAAGLDGFRMKIKNEFAQSKRHSYDVIILGDSYSISGVLPHLLEKKTGLTVFNLANFGDHGVFGSYCLFKNYLKKSKPPKYIVIEFLPDTLSKKKLGASFMYDFKKGNAWELMDEFGLSNGVKFQIPSLKHQYLFRKILKDSKMPHMLQKDMIDQFIEQAIADKGFYAPHANQAVAEPVLDEDFNKKYKFFVSYSARYNLNRILHLARDNHIQVIYNIPTFSWDWYGLYQKYGVIEGYSSFTDALAKQYPEVLFVSHQNSIQDLHLYADRLHLNINGAHDLTSALAGDILYLEK